MQTACNTLMLSAQETKQLVWAVLETDRSGQGACRGGKCSATKFPLVSHWDGRVPPVLVVQLTGVKAPLPIEFDWSNTLYITSPMPVGNRERQAAYRNSDAPNANKGKAISQVTERKMTLRVIVVPRLAFTKEVGYPIGQSFEGGTGETPRYSNSTASPSNTFEGGTSETPRYSLRHVAQPDPALKIEVSGKIVRGQAAWLAVGVDRRAVDKATAPARNRCAPPVPAGSEAFPATFIPYKSDSIIIGGEHYHLEIWQDRRTKEWRTRLCGVTIYL